jgi:hypothetical protein|tara:strand:- start:5367 stop:6152 length:786 start_codon:yes stop_codon:yes gene_type:complete
MIPIYIPTRGRVGKQTTWESIGPIGREHAVLVCPSEEIEEHKKHGRNCLDRGGMRGISNVRQFIINHAVESGLDKIIMLDDDLVFGRRISRDAPNLRKTNQQEMHELWERMEGLLDGFDHVGVSPRQMNDKHFPHISKDCMRQNAVHGLNPKTLHKEGIRYDAMPLMEDYYVTLKLFSRGYPNRVVVDWTWDQRGASGAAGGCSTYRDAALQETASLKLAQEFPDHVKAVQKTTKTGWEGMSTRWDVRVQWRKAAKDGKCF